MHLYLSIYFNFIITYAYQIYIYYFQVWMCVNVARTCVEGREIHINLC